MLLLLVTNPETNVRRSRDPKVGTENESPEQEVGSRDQATSEPRSGRVASDGGLGAVHDPSDFALPVTDDENAWR